MIRRFSGTLGAVLVAVGLLAAPVQAAPALEPVYATARGPVTKGFPGDARGTSKAAKLPWNFWYNEGAQTFTTPVTGAYSNFTPISPATASGDHSLVEIAVSKTGNSGQFVEVGINRDFNLYGDNLPHLFVFSWVNGVGKGYNAQAGSGWVDYAANPINAGADLTSYLGGANKKFGIQYSNSAWWVSFDNQWIGNYPGTNWTGASPSVTFVDSTYVQFFGEVASTNASPCTDMGNGTLGTTMPTPTPPAARVTSAQYTPSPNLAVLVYGNFPSVPTKYAVHRITDGAFDYGGPGFC